MPPGALAGNIPNPTPRPPLKGPGSVPWSRLTKSWLGRNLAWTVFCAVMIVTEAVPVALSTASAMVPVMKMLGTSMVCTVLVSPWNVRYTRALWNDHEPILPSVSVKAVYVMGAAMAAVASRDAVSAQNNRRQTLSFMTLPLFIVRIEARREYRLLHFPCLLYELKRVGS